MGNAASIERAKGWKAFVIAPVVWSRATPRQMRFARVYPAMLSCVVMAWYVVEAADAAVPEHVSVRDSRTAVMKKHTLAASKECELTHCSVANGHTNVVHLAPQEIYHCVSNMKHADSAGNCPSCHRAHCEHAGNCAACCCICPCGEPQVMGKDHKITHGKDLELGRKSTFNAPPHSAPRRIEL